MTTSPHQHLIPAIRKWMLENHDNVQLIVNPEQVDSPFLRSFAVDGKLVLSVSHRAIEDFSVERDTISFRARFGGRPEHVVIPATSVTSIAAFDGDGENYKVYPLPVYMASESKPQPKKDAKPILRVVK